MSNGNNPLELIGEARAALGRTKESLLTPSPETLVKITPLLMEASDCLQRFKTCVESEESDSSKAQTESSGQLRFLAAELSRDLNDVRLLAEQASGFYLGYASIVLSSISNYAADGEASNSTWLPQCFGRRLKSARYRTYVL